MRYRILHIILLLLAYCSDTYAQEPFTKDIWLNETNTPVKVNCIIQDSSGYMWLGTDDGLFNYNGRDFSFLPTIKNVPVTALAASENRIFVGFDNGAVGVTDGNTFLLKNLSGDTPSAAISAINLITEEIILLATNGEGIYLIANSEGKRFNTDNGLSDNYVYNIIARNDHSLLATTDQGINELTLGKKGKIHVSNYTTSNGLPDNIVRVIKPLNDGINYWIGTHQGGVAIYNSEKKEITIPQLDKQWKWGPVNDILPADDMNAWVCTERGDLLYMELMGSNFYYVTEYRYNTQKLRNLLSDNAGNIWCATNAGLKLITANYMYKIELPSPYSLDALTAMTFDRNNVLWFAQENELYRIPFYDKNLRIEHVYKASIPIKSLCIDDLGNLLIGTFGDGLWIRNTNGAIQKIHGVELLEKETILDVNSTGSTLWVAGLNGVHELTMNYRNNTVSLKQLFNKTSGIGSDYVYQVFIDHSRNIWMATDGAGICKYENGKFKHWDSTSGLRGKVVYCITEDIYGNIWAATLNDGLLKYTGDKWEVYDKAEGLRDINIPAIAANGTGEVIVVHAKGIDEWYPLCEQFRHYDRRLNLDIDTTSNVLKLITNDIAGHVYVPYESGLVRFNNIKTKKDITPEVSINSLSTLFTSTGLYKKKFRHSENHISFTYKGINFANPERLYYRYMLEGYNDTWIETRDEAATFPQLPSGSYTFRVQVSMNNKFSSFNEATYKFTIAKPFWVQIWFLALVALLLWLIAYLYIRIRENNLKKLSSLQRERMLFEYEHLKSQVNPHFLFNSLNTLTSLIEDDTQAALKYTTQLSDLYRNMLSYRDKDLITLEEEWEIMENYMYIQQSRFGPALNVKANVPEKLRHAKKIVPMALQLLLENAIKHNIVSLSKPLTITIDVSEDRLIVRNNYQPKISKEKGAGLGLMNIRKRYGLLTKKEVISKIHNNEFIVIIPLL